MTIGFRILRRARKVDAGAAAKYKTLPLANVSDVMSRMWAGGSRLRPMHGKGALAGPALTVKTRPGDNLMVHKALDLAEPGDVIVVDAGGDITSAIIGELAASSPPRLEMRCRFRVLVGGAELVALASA